ncbi:MAG: hypothetical protein ACI9FN_000262 [Saprospiraceae bacterium]|jgi:hypothetical protein
MYIIQYCAIDPLMEEIRNRLEDLSLAYKIEKVDTASETSLMYSGASWAEREAILEHLNQTEEELKKWHYCNC